MAQVSHSAASSDLQVFRGSRLSSQSSDYLVLDLIGRGAFAKVVKCVKLATDEKVAVRITRTHSASEAKEEASILHKLRDFDPDIYSFVRWDNSFIYKAHLCEEFELLDMNLREYVNTRQTSPLLLQEIQFILHQVATALQVLQMLGIAHGDLKPENIMLVDHVRQPLKVKLIDFRSACEVSKAGQGSYIPHRWYRAPETILDLPCNEAIDMWSLGCIATELFLGNPLYPGCCDYETIWMITQTQGHLPGHFLNAGLRTSRFYRKTWPNMWKLMTPYEYGRILSIDCLLSSLDDLKKIQQHGHPSEGDFMRYKADLEYFVELVKQMLQLDPAQRITPSQVLQHPFITKSHLMDFCCPQSLSSDESDLQPPSESQTSTRSSCGAPNTPQKPLTLPEENKTSIAHTKPRRKRKRVYAEISQVQNRSPGSSSPIRKKRKNFGGRRQVKRPYSDISEGSKRSPGNYSPETKRRRTTVDSEEKDTSKVAPSTEIQLKCQRKNEDKTETEGTDTELVSTPKEVPSTVIQLKSQRMQEDRKETDEKDMELPSSQKEAPSTEIQLKCSRDEQKKETDTELPSVSQATPSTVIQLKSENKKETEGTDTELPSTSKAAQELPSTSEAAPSTVIQLKCPNKKEDKRQTDEKYIDLPRTLKQIRSTVIRIKSQKMQEDRKDRDKDLPSTSKAAPSTVIQLKCPRKNKNKTKIWIIGSSYVRRAEEAANENFGENFGLNAEVEWFGKGGMRWSGVIPRFYAELANTQSPPDILVIHAGGNDLGQVPAMKLASIMQKELTQLRAEFPSMTIVYSCINQRQAWRHGLPGKVNTARKTVNKYMRKAVKDLGGEVIEHPLLQYFDDKMFLADGVHFTKTGNAIFVTSIHCTLNKILQSL